MELSDLVRTRAVSDATAKWSRRVTRAVIFFALGACIWAASVALTPAAPAEDDVIEVVVHADATDVEVRELVDARIAVQEAIDRGWIETDPVIRGRLIHNLRFAAGESEGSGDISGPEGEALLEQAIALEMHLSDPVVIARALTRIHGELERPARLAEPSEEELLAHMNAHPLLFERAGAVRFEQHFFSFQARGDGATQAAEDWLAARTDGGAEPPVPDPLLVDLSGRLVDLSDVAEQYGEPFAEVLDIAGEGGWTGPVHSTFGAHVIRVLEREPGGFPPLEDIRSWVLSSYRAEIRDEIRSDGMEELRAQHEVRVIRRGEP